MRKNAGAADLQRWSEEVALDAGAPSFVSLADAYRRQGNRDVALRVCMRGLERNPTNIEAHLLLARLYLDGGDRERAHDEWGITLRLDADNFDAHRGIGFVHLERGDFGTARRHLDKASAARPGDPAVQEALLMLAERLPAKAEAQAPAEAREERVEARQQAPAVAVPTPMPLPTPPTPAPPPTPSAQHDAPTDPANLFQVLRRETPFLGAVLLDEHGLVLAGALGDEAGGVDAEALGAILNGAIQEAGRTAQLLELGDWKGILLETETAQLHISALADGFMVLIAARSGAPAGWIVRTAQRASELSRTFLAGGA